MGSLAMYQIEFRCDTHGDIEIGFIDADDASSPLAIARAVRSWGESRGSKSVWFRIDGCSPGRLNIEDPNAFPVELFL